MTLQTAMREPDAISFLNRDHVVLVTIANSQIEVTTTLGLKVVIPATPPSLARFVDELANHVESNFVSITSPWPL
jgi:hypothetical protein